MEKVMLTTIGFDLLVPTAFDFVHTFSSILRLESHTTCLAMYLAELTILDAERYLQYLPSIIATAAIAVARYTFQVTNFIIIKRPLPKIRKTIYIR